MNPEQEVRETVIKYMGLPLSADEEALVEALSQLIEREVRKGRLEELAELEKARWAGYKSGQTGYVLNRVRELSGEENE